MLILEKDDGPSWFSPKDGSFPSSALPPKKSNPHPPDFLAHVYSKRPNLFSFKEPKYSVPFPTVVVFQTHSTMVHLQFNSP